MPESAMHAKLVLAVVEFVERELGPLTELSIRNDALRPVRGEKPPRIGGYTPDVHASDVPTTRTLIGEAKTKLDLESDHSQRQISAFLEYLSVTEGGIFVLAVPFGAGATARRVVKVLNAPYATSPTQIVVLDGAGEPSRPLPC